MSQHTSVAMRSNVVAALMIGLRSTDGDNCMREAWLELSNFPDPPSDNKIAVPWTIEVAALSQISNYSKNTCNFIKMLRIGSNQRPNFSIAQCSPINLQILSLGHTSAEVGGLLQHIHTIHCS